MLVRDRDGHLVMENLARPACVRLGIKNLRCTIPAFQHVTGSPAHD